MEEVSVGAAGSTSVVDLSGDSHLQVKFIKMTETPGSTIDTPGSLIRHAWFNDRHPLVP